MLVFLHMLPLGARELSFSVSGLLQPDTSLVLHLLWLLARFAHHACMSPRNSMEHGGPGYDFHLHTSEVVSMRVVASAPLTLQPQQFNP